MIIKTILNFFINVIHILSILFLINICINCAYAVKSNGSSSTDQNNKITKRSNSINENIIFINRRTSSFSKIRNFIPKIHNSLKRRKSRKQSITTDNNFKSYINDNHEQTSIDSLNTEKNKNNTIYTNSCSFNSSSGSYQQTPNEIEGNNIYLNRFMGKIIQITSENQPYLIETQEESPDINSYMDMSYFFINRIASLIPTSSCVFFYKGYYAPQIIILGSLKLDTDSENNKIIYADEYCIYETILSTTCKKLINYMILRIGEPFKNIHQNIEIEPHSYYIRNLYLSICILKKIQLTIIYPEKNASHNMLEINNLSYKSVRQHLKNITFPVDLANEINDCKYNDYEYNDYEKKILFIIERQRYIFDNFDTIILYLGNPSLYGLKVINIQMNYTFVEALNNLKISLYSFESKKPESINNRKLSYEYSGYYILTISILLADQIFTRYIKINGFAEATSESFDLITNHIKYIIYDIFKESADEGNSFVLLLSLLVCYNQKDNLINHDNIAENNLILDSSTEENNLNDIKRCKEFTQDSDILQFEESPEDIDSLLFEDTHEDNDSLQSEDFLEDNDSLTLENLPNCDKLDNIYENSNICLIKNQDITEISNIEDTIKDIDLIAISIPTLLIINIINPEITLNNSIN
jgi:hypothetical protein